MLSKYILFLSKVISISDKYQKNLAKLLLSIKAAEPKYHKNLSIRTERELPDGLLDEFMLIANFSNPNNPFKDIGIKKEII